MELRGGGIFILPVFWWIDLGEEVTVNLEKDVQILVWLMVFGSVVMWREREIIGSKGEGIVILPVGLFD